MTWHESYTRECDFEGCNGVVEVLGFVAKMMPRMPVFMCSFRGKLDAWMPKTEGTHATPIEKTIVLDEMRIAVKLDGAGRVAMSYGARPVADLDELERLCASGWAELVLAKKDDARAVIDAEPRVPWRELVAIVDRLKARGIDAIAFAQPLEVARR